VLHEIQLLSRRQDHPELEILPLLDSYFLLPRTIIYFVIMASIWNDEKDVQNYARPIPVEFYDSRDWYGHMEISRWVICADLYQAQQDMRAGVL
jgi:hypothetical protein